MVPGPVEGADGVDATDDDTTDNDATDDDATDDDATDDDADTRRPDERRQNPAAAYVFRIRFRVEPDAPGVRLEPSTFETTVYRRADEPGEPGWLYFRDNLWRGECGDEEYMRGVFEEGLGVTVRDVRFRELRTTRAYLEDLRTAIATDLDLFNAANADEVLSKYIGSSIHVTEDI